MNLSDYEGAVARLQKHFGDAPTMCITTGTSGPRFEAENKPLEFNKFLALPFGNAYIHMADGHAGKIDVIEIAGKNVCVLQGRLHFYQGYTIEQVVFLSRVMVLWGCKKFLCTNASGTLSESKKVGKIVNVTDHVLHGSLPNPMIGIRDKELGKLFTSMYKPYGLAPTIEKVMMNLDQDVELKKMVVISGVYHAIAGPSFESLAEASDYKTKADLAGMSTIPEVIAWRSMNITDIGVLALVTNNTPVVGQGSLVTHEDNTAVAEKAAPYLRLLITEIVKVVA